MMSSNGFIVLADLNYYWTNGEAKRVINGYKSGKKIIELSTIVRRPIEEIALLLIDLGKKDKI
jgi:hypothetical protein